MTVSPITVRSGMMLATILVLTAGCSSGESKTRNSTTASTTVASPRVGGQSVADSTGEVIRRYYEAIQSHRYDDAYAIWSDSGRASGQTPAGFAAGFGQTTSVTVSVGDSVSVEGAAGSQYATVPVTVDATLRSGERQHFKGTYTLRRSFVDGASPQQREWQIYSADLRR